jgi:hypothetical protein
MQAGKDYGRRVSGERPFADLYGAAIETLSETADNWAGPQLPPLVTETREETRSNDFELAGHEHRVRAQHEMSDNRESVAGAAGAAILVDPYGHMNSWRRTCRSRP